MKTAEQNKQREEELIKAIELNQKKAKLAIDTGLFRLAEERCKLLILQRNELMTLIK